ncbi:MAG: heme o synthase [Desulfuromonadales bacterium]|nr:heme o synthase [Desulfuromonadales bacterium]
MIRALLRPSLCSAVAISALVGYLAAGGAPGPRMAWLATGIMLAATGATILNQWQERHIDALMVRTRHRPLACGRLSPRIALGGGASVSAGGDSATDRS